MPIAQQPKATGISGSGEAVSQPTSASIRAMRRVAEQQRARKSRRVRIAVGLSVLAVAVLGLRMAWVVHQDSDAVQRRASIESAGIEPGEMAPAKQWLANARNEVRGLQPAAADALINAFERGGAVAIDVLRIDDARAASLLVELPNDPDSRRTILWQAARAQGREPSLEDDQGQRYLELRF